jgi:hypothetical protein
MPRKKQTILEKIDHFLKKNKGYALIDQGRGSDDHPCFLFLTRKDIDIKICHDKSVFQPYETSQKITTAMGFILSYSLKKLPQRFIKYQTLGCPVLHIKDDRPLDDHVSKVLRLDGQ